MVITAIRLWPYFQAHSIKVLTNQPLRRILQYSETSGRLIQLSIELGEFDIEYRPRIAVKAQVLADFLIEYTYHESEELLKEEPKPWVLQVDGSTIKEASKAGLILTSQKDNAVGVEHLLAKSDSQLVVGQVLGEYTVKEEVMQKYIDKVKAQVAKLRSFDIVQAIDYSNSWTGPIVEYITNGTLPDDKVKARQLKIRAAKYLLMGDMLYRRSFSLLYLRCLTRIESE
ncbi:hypothetical protein RHSIM_Rhsim10G0110200 [Rhododendron simsii]|uniref:Uncharacterized protein n=1 Tax=Rhododendron simsii TaxID=118357 RepID=A0A834GEB7_RHOSS|nr:hypothetical protein RHSIM_Rhsim10G0110200 [Rhododendron simsii]